MVKHLFDPFEGRIKEKMLYHVVYPIGIGIGFLFLFFNIPHINKNELGIYVLLVIYASFVYLKTVSKYKKITYVRTLDYQILNRNLIIFVSLFPLIKIASDRGFIVTASTYRSYLVEWFVLIFFGIVLAGVIIFIIRRKLRKRRKRIEYFKQMQEEFEKNNREFEDMLKG
jgi:cbb3-type cytochrome oxidase subunit 3